MRDATAATFTLSLTCELHGAGISIERVTIDAGGMVTTSIDTMPDPPRTRQATPAELAPIADLLASKPFAAFIAEIPTPATDHPGRKWCTLAVEPYRFAKKWGDADDFTPASEAARAELMSRIGTLTARKP